jgi:hypothetical protein
VDRSTFTLNLDGVKPWRPERRPRELERRLAKMDPAYREAETPGLAEQRAGEVVANRLNAPLQEAWQREKEAGQRRAQRRWLAAALGTTIARATAHRGRHRRAPGSSSARRRGSRRSAGGSDSGDDGGGEPEPARGGHLVAAATREAAA